MATDRPEPDPADPAEVEPTDNSAAPPVDLERLAEVEEEADAGPS